MRSTQRLLENPLALESGNRGARFDALQNKLDNVIAEIPDTYVDAYQYTIMEEPCNIKLLPQNPDTYIDKKYVGSCYQFNPVDNKNDDISKAEWADAWRDSQRYRIDKKHSARIEAWLHIQEIKQYLHELPECTVITTEHSLKACEATPEDIPASFFSKMPNGKVMTFPVMLDNNPRYIIDFFELLASQPTPESIIKGHYQEYIKESISKLQAKFDDIALLLDTCSPETLPQEEKDRIVEEESSKYRVKYKALCEEKTLEWYKNKLLHDAQLVECYNPFTKQPIKAIAIQYDLMMEIDQFIAAPFKWQQHKIQRIINAAEPSISYADRLTEKKFPRESIPEALLCGYNPSQPDVVEVMTHPILLNGEFYIDYARLKAYWESANFISRFFSGTRQGLNPMNGQPLISISYDFVKKNAMDHFMANLEAFRITMTERDIRNPHFLHKSPRFPHFEFGKFTRKQILPAYEPEAEETLTQTEVCSM